MALVAAFIFLLSVLCFAGRNSVATAGPGQDRILKKRSWSNEPVAIKLVKTKKGSVKLGEKFSDGDDWFEGLMLRIENISDKPIIFITVNLRFLRPANETGLPFTHIMQYGQRAPTVKLEAVVSDRYAAILPGRFVDLSVSKQDYDAIKSSLAQLGFSAGIQRIDVTLGSVIFDDGTHWQTVELRTDRSKSRLLDEALISSPIHPSFFCFGRMEDFPLKLERPSRSVTGRLRPPRRSNSSVLSEYVEPV